SFWSACSTGRSKRMPSSPGGSLLSCPAPAPSAPARGSPEPIGGGRRGQPHRTEPPNGRAARSRIEHQLSLLLYPPSPGQIHPRPEHGGQRPGRTSAAPAPVPHIEANGYFAVGRFSSRQNHRWTRMNTDSGAQTALWIWSAPPHLPAKEHPGSEKLATGGSYLC